MYFDGETAKKGQRWAHASCVCCRTLQIVDVSPTHLEIGQLALAIASESNDPGRAQYYARWADWWLGGGLGEFRHENPVPQTEISGTHAGPSKQVGPKPTTSIED